jgi:hypothetical protein
LKVKEALAIRREMDDDKNNSYKSYTVNKQFSFVKSELPSSPC